MADALLAGWRRVTLGDESQSLAECIEVRRTAAVAILRQFAWAGMKAGVAVGPKPGRPRTEREVALFRRATEGRAWTPGPSGYSTCGELFGVVYALLGVRDEAFVNRDDDDVNGMADAKEAPPTEDEWWVERGKLPWKVGWNLTLMKAGAKRLGCWVDGTTKRLPLRGDSLLVGDGMAEHVLLLAEDPTPHPTLADVWVDESIEGGQVDASGQCVKVYVGTYLRWQKDRFIHGRLGDDGGLNPKSERLVQGYVCIGRVPLQVPALVPPECPVGTPVEGWATAEEPTRNDRPSQPQEP